MKQPPQLTFDRLPFTANAALITGQKETDVPVKKGQINVTIIPIIRI